MSNTLLPFLAWSFLPDLATNYTQTILYTLLIRAGDPKPATGTPRHTTHRQYIHLTILLLYFTYTLYEAHWDISRAGSFYDFLTLPPSATDKEISSRFRRLTLQHHPDKSSSATTDDSYFIALTTARDTLLDPHKRFAYDRFGPAILTWTHAHSTYDFVTTGLRSIVAPHYLGWSILLAILQWLGWFSADAFWRWLAFAGLGAFEVACVTRPSFPQQWIWDFVPSALAAPWGGYVARMGTRGYLPFQTVAYARRASLTFFVALSRLGPLLKQMRAHHAALAGSPPPPAANDDVQMQRLLTRLETTAASTTAEAGRLLALQSVPFLPSPVANTPAVDGDGGRRGLGELSAVLKAWFIRNAIRSDRDVVGAWTRAVARRHRGAITPDSGSGSGSGREKAE